MPREKEGESSRSNPIQMVFRRLARNAWEWMSLPSARQIQLRQVEISDTQRIRVPLTDNFHRNQGSVSFEQRGHERPTIAIHTARVQRLDNSLDAETQVGSMKIDVEGHEMHALKGATALLSSAVSKTSWSKHTVSHRRPLHRSSSNTASRSPNSESV
jgi:FkbM family methyltransferase